MKVQLETPPSVETCPEPSPALTPVASVDYAQEKFPRRMIVVDQEQFKSLSATIAIGRAYIAQTLGNIPDTVRYASRVLELTEADPFRQSQASMLLGMTYWTSGDLEAAERVFAECTTKLQATGNIPDAISTSVVLADIKLALGHLHEAINTLEQLLQFVMDQGEPIPPDAADLHRELSKMHLEQGNLEAATQYLQRSKELGEKAQSPVSRYRLCIDQAQLKRAQGDQEGALALLNEAQRLYIRSPLPDFSPIPAMKARIWAAQGKWTKALEWASQQGLPVEDAPSYLREFEHLTLARVLIARAKSDRGAASIKEAIGLLERLLQAAKAGRRIGSVIEILVLLALAQAEKGDLPQALLFLERALRKAEPEGYVQIFVDEGVPMAQLLSEAAARGIMRNYTATLLAAVQNNEQMRKDKPDPLHPQPLIDPLSQREIEVLQLIAQGLSNREIGERLFLALSTVKGYNQKIFDKLQVQSRTEAIVRARELGLV
jgi:LuxR family maltose regulon positive regulatory protein